MTNLKQIYKCSICGNVVEVLHSGAGSLVCCEQEMNLQEEHVEFDEKHTPVVEEEGDEFVVSVNHVMDETHFVEWLEVVFENDEYTRTFLSPTHKSRVVFLKNGMIKKVRIYCNLHGLWINNLDS